MPRSMAYARCGHAHVVTLHGSGNPTDTEWQSYLQDLDRWLPELVGFLVVTSGPGPTSRQRSQSNTIQAQHRIRTVRVAVVSDSLLARGIVNAFNLFNPGIRTFRPTAMQDALVHIGAALHGPIMIAEVERLRERVR
jgi:hypothetical protein